MNKISFLVGIRGHVPHFVSLQFVTFVSLSATRLVICIICIYSEWVNFALVNNFFKLGGFL